MTLHLRSHLRQSPFPLLFKLEMILLSVVMMAVLWMMFAHPSGLLTPATSLVPTIVALLLFTSIGLVIPTKAQDQLLYLLTEFLLIFVIFMGAMVPFFQMLFITVVIRNCVLFRGHARSIATGITAIGYLGCQVERLRHPLFAIAASPEQSWIFGLVSMVTFGLVVLFLQLFVDAILKEQDSKQALAIAHIQLQRYALQVEDLATVQERNRIARDIHDSLGHSLSIFNLHLEAALRLLHKKPLEAEALLREVQAVGQQAMNDVSHSVTTLRSDPLNGQSLHLSILSLLHQFELSTGVSPQCHWDQRSIEDLNLSNIQKMTVYRIIQESLTNVRKYAGATEVEIRIERGIKHNIKHDVKHNLRHDAKQAIQSSGEYLNIHISDNGKGFDRSPPTSGFGLQGMQERLAVLSGYLEIQSAPHEGCQVWAAFPIASPTTNPIANPTTNSSPFSP